LLIGAATAVALVGYSGSTRAGHPATASAAGAPAAGPDAFTPVTVTPLGSSHSPVLGTDGAYHLVYELQLTNTKLAPATLLRVDVLDAGTRSRVIASFAGPALLGRLRTLQPQDAQSARIAPDVSRLFYIELSFAKLADIPSALTHHVWILGAANPGTSAPTPLDYVAGRVELDKAPLPVLGPPLAGAGWVATNGCCNSLIIHRGSVQSVNGALYDAQRFAIDYMRLNAAGEFVHGDAAEVRNYVDYGADVLAVADGSVVSALDTLNDQPPGRLPNPADLTLQTVDGNHVVLDLGHGRYAFYAHLRKGSVTVHVGQRVTKGTVIGKVGNSGNTSAPHLHFHLVNSPSALGSDGVPYLISGFDLAGQVDIRAFEAAPGISGMWGRDRLAKPLPQAQRFPLNLNIINFPGR
jgi:hypothetical protein